MKSAKTEGVIFLLLILLSGGVCFSAWSQPEFLSELNDYDQVQVATHPCISADGLSMFFVRKDPSLVSHGGHSYFITEARRDSIDGPFEDQRALTELGNNGSHLSSPWISEDGLRLYYIQTKHIGGQWPNLIYMADRKDINSPWVPKKIFYELHIDLKDSYPSMTSDELNIMWASGVPGGMYPIYTASRPTISSNFSDIKEVTELTDIGATSPFISADGLGVYFTIRNAEGIDELWMGKRSSPAEPFGDFTPMDEINQWGLRTMSPCISPDGQSLYYFQRRGEPADIYSKGVFVSHWFLTPYEQAVKNLNEAIAAKEQAHQLLTTAVEKEQAALKALSEIDITDLPDSVAPQDIRRGHIEIFRALQRQVNALADIKSALSCLKEAWALINPPALPEEPAQTETDS